MEEGAQSASAFGHMIFTDRAGGEFCSRRTAKIMAENTSRFMGISHRRKLPRGPTV